MKSNANGHTPQPHKPEQQPLSQGGTYPEEVLTIWKRRARALAEPPQAEDTGDTIRALIFHLGGEKYGVDVTYVSKIYSMGRITAVPRTPPFVIGIFSARGRLVSIIDLRKLWGLPQTELTAESKIIVLAEDQLGMEIGIVADSVQNVTNIFREELDPTLTTQSGQRAGFTLGIVPGMVMVLNPVALLQDKKLVIQEEIT